MKIIKIISEWKKKPKVAISTDKKMVEAVLEIDGEKITRHIAVAK